MISSKITVIIIISFLTSFSIFFPGCIEINGTEDIHTITAMQRKNLSEETASEWNEDYTIVLVGSVGKGDDKGGRTAWYYSYYSSSSTKTDNNVTKYEHINIRVTSENEVSTDVFWSRRGKGITNWTIDSDEAVEIAKQEPQIESYLDEYPRASLGMTLKMWERLPDGRENPNRDSATWSIGWSDSGGMFDDPAHARVFINANTGEVLYVDADV